MIVKRIQTVALLALLVTAQLLDGVHGTGHISSPDDQVCSQCLHARPKQYAALPAFALVLATTKLERPSLADASLFQSTLLLPPRSRGPPSNG